MNHNHSLHGCACEHQHDDPNRGDEYSLYAVVDNARVRAMNAVEADFAYKLFKPWDERFTNDYSLTSDADEELLIYIPFTASVKLKSIALLGLNDASAPSKMNVWINRTDIDFDSVGSIPPTQFWECIETVRQGELAEYPTRIAKFNGVTAMYLHIPSNFGADATVLKYIGLKGEWSVLNRDPVIALYESSARPVDHKNLALGTKAGNYLS